MGVAPFVLLGDSALQAIALVRPGDRSALARIPGLGPRTLAKFGEDLLRLIHDSVEQPSSGVSAHVFGESAVTDRSPS
jgi:superfamily II DNA helicase RecQ